MSSRYFCCKFQGMESTPKVSFLSPVIGPRIVLSQLIQSLEIYTESSTLSLDGPIARVVKYLTKIDEILKKCFDNNTFGFLVACYG